MKTKLTTNTERKLWLFVIVGIIVILAAVVVGVLAVSTAQAAGCEGSLLSVAMCLTAETEQAEDQWPVRMTAQDSDCPVVVVGWILLDPPAEGVTYAPPEGWTIWADKCGQLWLIPITPSEYPEPEPYPGP